MVENRFQFYEVVRVSESYSRFKDLIGLEGTILGMAESKEGRWGYAVLLYELGETWDIAEDDLEPTGRMDARDRLYDGTKASVVVDRETGAGKITRFYPAQDRGPER